MSNDAPAVPPSNPKDGSMGIGLPPELLDPRSDAYAPSAAQRRPPPNPWRDVDDDLFVSQDWTVATEPPGHELKGMPGKLVTEMRKLRELGLNARLAAPGGQQVDAEHEAFVAARTLQWYSWRVELHVGAVKSPLFKGPKPKAIDAYEAEQKVTSEQGTVVLIAGNGNVLDQYARLTTRRPVVNFTDNGPEVSFPQEPFPRSPVQPDRPSLLTKALRAADAGRSMLKQALRLVRGSR